MRTLDHPLGIKPTKRPRIETPHPEVDTSEINPIAQVYATLPDKFGVHSWGSGLRFPASVRPHQCTSECTSECDSSVDVRLSLSMVVGEIPATCFVCEQHATPETIQATCPGDPNGLFWPTKRQFMGWDQDDILRWIDEYLRIHEENDK